MKVFITGSLGAVALVSSITAHASYIQPNANFANFTRSCPAVAANPTQYLADWGDAMVSTGSYGTDVAALTLDNACHFNGSWQASRYNSDGTPKSWNGGPSGVPFSIHAPGSLNVDQSSYTFMDVDGNTVIQGNQDDKHKTQVTFKDQTQGTSNLLMPEIKFATFSDEGQRNSTNVSAWTGFERIAGTDDIDLQIVIDFDFFNSSQDHAATTWGDGGIPPINDYAMSLFFGAAYDVEDEDNVFPTFINTIGGAGFNTRNDIPFAQIFADDPYRGQLILDLSDISVGETVYFYFQGQAFGFNGGFVDAFNTVRTKIQVAGVSEAESEQILSQQFSLARTSIPEPASLALLVSGLGLIGLRRRRK